MTLHYRRPNFVVLGLFLLGGLVAIYASQTGYELRLLFIPLGSVALLVVGALAILFAAWGVRRAFRPDPVVIQLDGLRLRVAGVNRVVPWEAIDAVLLEPYTNPGSESRTHRLVIVPAAGADLWVAASYQNQVDGRASIILLALDEIRESHGEVSQALMGHAGQRFVPETA
jgi:hypothetical protein